MQSFKLFERTYNINLSTNKTDYQFVKRNNSRFNRLKHLVYQIEQHGSPLEGEKISEILLGSVNLNTLDLSYPFVDVQVVNPIKGVTKNNELISVKTSRDKHTLKDAVTYVNGFKIEQLIQFGMSKLNLQLYKSKIFKSRNAMKLSTVVSKYQQYIKQLFGDDIGVYTYAFSHSITILNFLKKYLKTIEGEEDKETNKEILFGIIVILSAVFIDKKFNTNYLETIGTRKEPGTISLNILPKKLENIKNSILNYFSTEVTHDFNSDYFDYGESLPNKFDKMEISYCILFFDKETDDGKVVLNLYKTESVSFSELFNNSMKIWLKKNYHKRALLKKENLYLNYEDVVNAFGGGDVFSTHIKVEMEPNWNYKERSQGVKKLYVKVIDKIKGIENDEKQKEILKLLNKYLSKINSGDDEIKTSYINKFKQFLDD